MGLAGELFVQPSEEVLEDLEAGGFAEEFVVEEGVFEEGLLGGGKGGVDRAGGDRGGDLVVGGEEGEDGEGARELRDESGEKALGLHAAEVPAGCGDAGEQRVLGGFLGEGGVGGHLAGIQAGGDAQCGGDVVGDACDESLGERDAKGRGEEGGNEDEAGERGEGLWWAEDGVEGDEGTVGMGE